MFGFGNHFSTEALKGALPCNQNNPQKPKYGLYAEQISGTAFTVPRHLNQKTWMYRILPSVTHEPFTLYRKDTEEYSSVPEQLRWDPCEIENSDFIDGLECYAKSGDPLLKHGVAFYIYSCCKSMKNRVMQNSDGDFLIVPQQGGLEVRTEMGLLKVEPLEICVIPRGIKFQINVDSATRGYILEVYDGHFELPDLGAIGANGLANPRHFEYPTASFENSETIYTLINKFGGDYFKCSQHSPFDVVAWHGNYSPFKYNLTKFNVINSVSFDHIDPSIFTVLTCKSNRTGVAVADFAIFPPRFAVQENTFRPPYFHRNLMTEFMGLIKGKYEAKKEGFVAGGASLHSCMSAHGPDKETFDLASNEELKPVKLGVGTMAFMFESCYIVKVNEKKREKAQKEYYKAWIGLTKNFIPK